MDPELDMESIVSLIRSLLHPDARNVHLLTDTSHEATINIGFPGSASMINLFKHLEDNQAHLRVSSNRRCKYIEPQNCYRILITLTLVSDFIQIRTFGTSVSTMEDVFLRNGKRDENPASDRDRIGTLGNITGKNRCCVPIALLSFSARRSRVLA